MKRTGKLFLAVLLFWLIAVHLRAGNEFFGYFENRFFLIGQRDVSWKEFNQKFRIGDYNRLRLMGKFSPADKVVLNVAVDFFTFHGIMKSPLGIYDSSQQPGSHQDQLAKIDLDRAYVELYFKKFDISIGKQRVAMGVSYLWAPLDIFNRINIFEPKEEKPGATAFRIYVPFKGKSSLTGVFAPEADFGSSKSALRLQSQWRKTDIGLTLLRWGLRDTTVWGLDLRGENFIGWWLEGGLFSSPSATNYKVVVGFDYTFPIRTGLYWMSEFFYDSSGESDPGKYDFQKLLAGDRFTLSRTYFFSMLRYAFSEFFSAAFAYIGNWNDGSYLLNPVVSYDLTQSVIVSTGFYFPLGRANGEFSRGRQDVFFIWLKINF